MSFALAFTITASAQVEPLTKEKLLKQNVEQRLAPQEMNYQRTAVMDKRAAAPMRAYVDSMYYARPEGTLYNSWEASNGNKYCYLVFPNFTEVTFTNMTNNANIEKTLWWWSANDLEDEEATPAEADEDYNLTTTYAVPGGRLYYAPALTLGSEIFTIAEQGYAQVGIVSTDTIYELSKWDTATGYYTGYSGGEYGFGTGTLNFDFDDDDDEEEVYAIGLIEFFEKPAAPLYLTSITMPFVTNKSEALQALPEGKSLNIIIRKVVDDVLTDTIAEMEYTSEQFLEDFRAFNGGGGYAFAEIASTTTDVFGTVIDEPVIIEDAFAVVVTGYAEEGVDVGLFFGNSAEADYDYFFMTPTYEMYNDAVTHEYKGMLRTYGAASNGNLYCYNALMWLNCMFDVASIDEGYDVFRAPVEGGIIETEAEFESSVTGDKYHDNILYVYTSLPWVTGEEDEEEENYYLAVVEENEDEEAEWPEWLSVKGFSDQYYESYLVNMLQLSADALPEGETGRYAKIHIYSDKGADTGTILVVQGDVDIDKLLAIESVKTTATQHNNTVYSLTGQKVQNMGKGLYIKNGKKFFMK